MKTNKKVKVLGREEYINKNTGEVEEMQVIKLEDRDYNFDKIWLGHILDSLELAGNQKIKVISYILQCRNKTNNQLIKSQKEISKDVNVSLRTVSSTFKLLIECDVLIKEKNNVYLLNPNMIFKGRYPNRMNILIKYNELK